MIAEPSAAPTLRPVTLDDPTIRSWWQHLVDTSPEVSHLDIQPYEWLALYINGEIAAAMAPTYYPDGTIMVECAACAPTRAGRKAAEMLWGALAILWRGRRVLFNVAVTNRKMLRFVHNTLKAHPIAVTCEVIP